MPRRKKDCLFRLFTAKKAHGDGLLHAAQFSKAYKEKNSTMLIWLGKQRLNQKDNDQVFTNQTAKLAEEISKDIKQENVITDVA